MTFPHIYMFDLINHFIITSFIGESRSFYELIICLYGFVFLRCSKVHRGCFKKVTWTIYHPLSGLSLAQKRSCLKTHRTMRNMALVFRHIFCSPATHRPSYNNRQPSLVAMAARAGLPFYCCSYWFTVVHHHEIDDNKREENISSGNIIHIFIAWLLQICALLRYYTERRAKFIYFMFLWPCIMQTR